MTGPESPTRTARRSRQGLVIEGTLSHTGATPRPKPTLDGLDLQRRAAERPYQSLLDDAIRLAGRSVRAAGLRIAS